MLRSHITRSGAFRRFCLGVVAFALGGMLSGTALAKHGSTWVGTWATGVSVPAAFDAPLADPPFSDETLRQIVRISVGGKKVRVWLTNEHGTAPLQVAAAAVAIRDVDAQIVAGSSRALSFAGESAVVIAAGARVLSDPVDLSVPDLADLAVSMHVPAGGAVTGSPASYHPQGLQTSYVLAGDQTGEVDPIWTSTITSTFWLSAVDVITRKNVPVLAAFGDSITDGFLSTPNANKRWPNLLAERLLKKNGRHGHRGGRRVGVLNLGISGNQVTNTFIGDSALVRFARDVRLQTGVTHVLVLEGINDIGLPPFLNAIGIPLPQVEAAQIIAGYRQLIAQAHAEGLKIIGGTLTPSGNFTDLDPFSDYSTAAGEEKRQMVNAWIRDSGEFDDVVDFDAVLRDPGDPTIMRVDLSDDGLHPNDAGYELMAEAVKRRLFARGHGHDDDDD